ncbi:MAG TPA: LacI family DNA-binding transcriptional regulator [Spirillospora sp.]|nr:LacI family DNA-binding transcriptional regulator [Spirillospora sp.]
MSDVAERAGVNRVTVSVALNGSAHGGTRVSEATRQRVLDAARELGYAPSAVARALRGQRTNIIGYYTGHESLNVLDPFTGTVLNGLQKSCRQHHQDLLIFGSFERSSVDDIYASLAGGKIDGLVLLPTPHSPVMDKLLNSHLPIVAIANPVPNLPSVTIDDLSGSHLLANYMARQGHRHILYRGDYLPHSSTVRRCEAFLAAAGELGLRVTFSAESRDGHITPAEVELLTRAPAADRPTAVVSWVDSQAYVFIEDCVRLGIRVPDDLAVAGFDGIDLQIRPAYRLTTIRAPWEVVAATAVDLLMNLIDGEEVEREIMLPVTLVIGETA